MDRIGLSCKRLAIFAGVFLCPFLARASYFPSVLTPTGVTASTVAVQNEQGQALVIITTITQPVSGTLSINALPSGTNAIGTVVQTPYGTNASTIAVVNGVSALAIISTNTLNTSQQGNITINSIPAGSAIIGNVLITSTNTLNTSQQGNITLNALPAGSNIIGSVLITSTNTLNVAGTFWPAAAQITVSTQTNVQGMAASGASPSGNPVQDGREAFTSWPTAVSNAQMVAAAGDKMGRGIDVLDCPYDLLISTSLTLTASTAQTILLSSGTTGVYNDLVSLVVSNSGVTASLVSFESTGFTAPNTLHIYVPAGDTRGLTTSHIWPQLNSSSEWTATSSASSSSIYVDAVFCQRK